MNENNLGDSVTLCFSLVGQFLWHWAFLEDRIKDAIGAGLSLNSVQAHIVAKNTQLRDKIKILKGCVCTSIIDRDTREEFIKLLNDLSEFSRHRNMVAHDMFGPNPEGSGVKFLQFKTKNDLSFPDVTWDTDAFR